MSKQRTVALGDFLTDEQIRLAWDIWNRPQAGGLLQASLISDQVIKPNLAEINRKLGQENDSRYLAYAVCFAFQQGYRPERN